MDIFHPYKCGDRTMAIGQIVERIWTGILPGRHIHAGSNFFAEGGDSLAAAAMILEVERQTGKAVPLGQIYLTPELQAFSAAVEAVDPEDKAPLFIPLRAGTGHRPLFALAPAMGGVFHFRDLAASLPEELAIHVIEPRVSATGEHGYRSIEDIAQRSLSVVRGKQPQGPYRFIGYSFGGIVAWEMACQLKRDGQAVDLLVLMDSSCRNGYGKRNGAMVRFIREKVRFLREFRAVREQHGESFRLARCWPLIRRKLLDQLGLRERRPAGSGGPGLPDKPTARDMDVPAQIELRANYRMGQLEGPVDLFRATRQLTLHRELDYDLGWGRFLPPGGLRIRTFPGNHFSMVRQPLAREVASTLHALVAAADERIAGETDREARAGKAVEQLAFPEPLHGESLSNRFLAVCQAFAGKTAIRDGGFRMSYGELESFSRRIAAYILEHDPEGTGPVLLHFENSWQFVCSIYGVLLAGRCYLPGDPDFPELRIRELIGQSECRFALTLTPSRLLPLADTGLRIHAFAEAAAHTASAGQPVPRDGTPEADALMLFTSGSTGKPKGSTISRKMLLHVAWRRVTAFGLTPRDRYAIPYVSAFMGAAIAIHGALLGGSTICLYNLRRRGVDGLPEWMREERITVLHIITSVLRNFLTHWKGQPALPDLRLVIPGGERCRPSDLELWKSTCSDRVRFATCLGSTEAGTICANLLDMDYLHPGGPLPVGVPFASLRVRIIRDDGSPASPFEEGQIVLESDYIFHGYIREESLTRSVLFNRPDGRRLYLTGDYGFFDPNGILYNCGRRDTRVKVLGTLVDLVEVESAIMQSGLVENVVVLHRPVRPGAEDCLLVAFYQGGPPGTLELEQDLKQHLLLHLPKAMVPVLWIRLAALPQTANGKTDRRALQDTALSQEEII